MTIQDSPVRVANVAQPKVKIELSGAGKSFELSDRKITALQPVDLSIREHEFVSLVGPSGCGKSTVLNMVAGLLSPSSGEVRYDGVRIRGLNGRVGYIEQKDTLLPWRTAEDNISISLELGCRNVDRKEIKSRVAEIIEQVGLKGFEKHYPSQLSGGMRKRVSLARTLIYQPETLLMDEPFGALDAQLKLLMHDLLQRLTQERKMTVIFVTHDLGEAVALSEKVVVFSARPGKIRVIRSIPLGRPRDVFKVRFAEEFRRINEELWEELKDEVTKGTDN